MLEKDEILREFSSEPGRYYEVGLFGDEGFVRKSCSICGRFFWTLDASRSACPDDAPDTYSFIGDPPTSRRFDYSESWKQIKSFFSDNGHAAIGRYPVVCRWRDDLYFTIASIVDFQRVMGSKVVFEFPANPLVVPQTCLRFKDLENVGVTGRHFSSFCMVGQHSVPGTDEDGREVGYWKDECIRLDFELLTKRFGIAPEEIVFVEDVWAGGGSFGPSLEYFVRGLELGNAVFTEFQGELGRHTTLDKRIIDMGAGLERFAWITMGTPTAYDCCFGGVDAILKDALGVDADPGVLREYYTGVARLLDKSDDLWDVRRRAMRDAGITDSVASRMIEPLEGAYLISDHLRTLIFAIADGALPSNVGGGYNLRMMIRRIDERMRRLGISGRVDVGSLIDAHVDYLKETYPELDSKRDDVKTILEIEGSRYSGSRANMQKKIAKIRRHGGSPDTGALVTLYESDGITPEYLVEQGVIPEVPSDFYSRISELHQSARTQGHDGVALDSVPDTEMLFYGDDPPRFDATVLWSDAGSGMVALDRTSFYARGGGQEPDHGTINGTAVTDVQRHGGVILHKLGAGSRGEGGGRDGNGAGVPEMGEKVTCEIDVGRRTAITKNHTSTHILNASSRGVLGSWVWQHSAFKDVDHARLDITHHSPLTEQQVRDIEDAANRVVADDLPVSIAYMDRGTAEQKYGFSIYQGGVVPVKAVRIVSISDLDVEACGGTHVQSTGRIRRIRITRTKRIQDGVVRIEFVSGDSAQLYDLERARLEQAAEAESAQKEEIRQKRDAAKTATRELVPELVRSISESADGDASHVGGIRIYRGSVPGVMVCMLDSGRGNDNDNDNDGDDGSGADNDGGTTKPQQQDPSQSYPRDGRFHMELGKRLVREVPGSAYVGFFESGAAVRVVSYAGADAVSGGVDASRITAAAAAILGGGSSGNDPSFSQGGGTNSAGRGEAVSAATSEIRRMLRTPRGGAGDGGAGQNGGSGDDGVHRP